MNLLKLLRSSDSQGSNIIRNLDEVFSSYPDDDFKLETEIVRISAFGLKRNLRILNLFNNRFYKSHADITTFYNGYITD